MLTNWLREPTVFICDINSQVRPITEKMKYFVEINGQIIQ